MKIMAFVYTYTAYLGVKHMAVGESVYHTSFYLFVVYTTSRSYCDKQIHQLTSA